MVRLSPLPPGSFEIADEKILGSTVATAFSQRRKTLRNALKSLVEETELAELGIDATLRPEMLAIGDYVALANYLARRTDDSG
jgi:16S rRNA (adenine1518-N6/adenine1519-N6)-dimethyltransferase